LFKKHLSKKERNVQSAGNLLIQAKNYIKRPYLQPKAKGQLRSLQQSGTAEKDAKFIIKNQKQHFRE